MPRLHNGYPRRADGALGYRRARRQGPALGVGATANALLWAPMPGPTRADTLPELAPGGWHGTGEGEHLREIEEYRLRKLANERAKQRQIERAREAIQAQARAIGRRQWAEIMRTALRRLNTIGLAIDIAEALYDAWSENKRQQEIEAQRMSEMWAGKGGWSLYLDCSPASGITSPYHYPQLLGSSCLSLWTNNITERNFYTVQTTGGQTWRTFRLMESAWLDHPPNPPGLPYVYDQGNTYQQYRMLESTFQTNPAYYRRYGQPWSVSRLATGNPYANAIHPNLQPILGPGATPRPLPINWPRPMVNQWPQGHHAGYHVPQPQPAPAVGGVVTPATGWPAPGPGTPAPGTAPGTGTSGGSRPPSNNSGWNITPDGAQAFNENGFHEIRKPKPKEKETKIRPKGAMGLLLRAFASGTEVMDFIGSMKKSVPGKVKKRCGNDPLCLADWMWKNWDGELAMRFLGNLAYNAVEDAIVGRAIGKAQKWGQPYRNPFTGKQRLYSTSAASGTLRDHAFRFYASQKESP